MAQWFDDERKAEWEWEHDERPSAGRPWEEDDGEEIPIPVQSCLEFGPGEWLEYESLDVLEWVLRRDGKLPSDGLQQGRDYAYC